ncbi:MAG: outer membrane protein [Proteiniphilum sp.]|jgi:TonB-linked SusC/RagA family outer membrane protein|nr:outer membrane protein [Proteiniphilum sp.]
MKKIKITKSMKNWIMSLSFLSLSTFSLFAQNITVKGKVTDPQNEPLIGATVVVQENTAIGTVTDINGNYTLTNVPPNGNLEFSYVGMQKQIVAVKNRTTINVTMREDTELLEEVVVTGYGGTQLRSKLTNSISKVSNETLTVGVFSNPAQALSGAVPGLRVIQTSGNPGAVPQIVLRGGTNFDGSGSPLVMVDGQLRDGLNDINPEDIESMEVLKDAGATALYGARASNGVILVTTKSGKAGQRSLNFKVKLGLNYVNNPYTFLGAEDYITYLRKAYQNTPWAPKGNLTGATPLGTGNVYGKDMIWNLMKLTEDNKFLLEKGWKSMPDPINPTDMLIYRETDIAKYSFVDPSFTQDYNLNMSGGNDRGNYYAGLGYNHSEGLPITSYYKRYNFVLNGSYKVTDWLKTNSNFNYNRANWQAMPPTQTSEANYFGRIQSTPPTARFEDEEGNMLLGPNSGDGNQLYQAHRFKRDNQTDKFTMIQSAEAKLLKNLTLKASAQWYYSEGFYESFNRDYEANPGKWNRTRSSSAEFDRNFSQTYNATLNYNRLFAGKHNIEALLGAEYFDKENKGFNASGSGAPTDDFWDLGLTDTGEGKRSIDSWHSQYRILSYFGRANYDYQGKYLISGVFRYDGYSSLLGDNRWGFFPGVSAGWIFGNEDFVKENLPVLSFGKLRSSFGVNGNASGIGPYTLQGSYSPQTYNGRTGFLIGTLPNPGLRWEKTRTFEVGADVSFFENRLNTNLTYYSRLTMDKYAAFALPSTTGFSSITNNNGEFRNRGLELELSGRIIRTENFSWEMKGNITYNKNKIISLPENGLERNRQGGIEIYTGKKVINPETELEEDEKIFVGGYQEGQEPGLLVGYQFDGIYKSVDEIPGNLVVKTGNDQGKYQYGPTAYAALTEAQKKNAILIEPGDAKWKDINGDGIIESFDRIVIGNTTPRYIGGFNTTFKYKNFLLYGRFDFGLDFWTYDMATPWFLGCMQGTYNTTTDVFDTWTPENPNAKYPRYVWADQLGTGNVNRPSTLFAYKGDYLAFREISLAYSLPQHIAKKLYMQALNVSVTGQNLGYLTAAPIASPERALNAGVAMGTGYGLPRTLLFGINLTF